MTDTLYKPWLCSTCGYKMDAASGFGDSEDAIPKSGDVSFCLNCGAAYMLRMGAWAAVSDAEYAGLELEVRRTLDRARAIRRRAITDDLSRSGGRA